MPMKRESFTEILFHFILALDFYCNLAVLVYFKLCFLFYYYLLAVSHSGPQAIFWAAATLAVGALIDLH